MGNNINLLKMIVMMSFLILFGVFLLITQSESFYRFNLKDVPAFAKDVPVEQALSEAEMQKIEQDKVLLVYDSNQKSSIMLKDNVKNTLEFMKKEYKAVPAAELPADFREYENIIILFSDLELMQDISLLKDYVFDGGKVLFAIRPDTGQTFESIHDSLGIREPEPLYLDTSSVQLKSDLLLNSKGMKIADNIFLSNSSLHVSLEKTSRILATTDREIPFLWSNPHGKGEFMVFNGTMLASSMNRGFLAGALSFLNENYMYPILNSKVVYIDDFPAPLPEGLHDAIYADYNLDTEKFFHNVWWPDMLKMAKEYDLKYTVGVIETYNNDVDGPFNERLSDNVLKIFGRELIQMGGELAVHGYNHQSLTLDQKQVDGLGYNAWKSQKDMVASLKELRHFIQEIFPGYTVKTYIPPSNVLSEEGKEAIKEAIPSISNIASLHIADDEGIAYIQEYEVSEDFNEIPRLTSNYGDHDEEKWIIANGASLYGTFSHFVHPDDILDKERSKNDGWHELKRGFLSILKDLKEKYPWMESMTASESAESLKAVHDAQVKIQQDERKIEGYINRFQGKLDFLLRSEKKLINASGCEVKKISGEHYLVRAVSPEFTIELGDGQ
ncbi:DUF2194 domain-containing protein [Bacillus infantis]|uniref:DUF2194 domain-containing protein n=1 Tax=Bacillus infantis TaxID=324767 RepID=UPI001CD5A7E6|nr:DUF2194 domain-containing protein [Bacillus infantis]MCA1041526.1 DUF2194 domain-containing protein [Bacillus infantis]